MNPTTTQELTTPSGNVRGGIDERWFGSTTEAALEGVEFENTSETEELVCLRNFGPEVNPNAPEMGANKNQ